MNEIAERKITEHMFLHEDLFATESLSLLIQCCCKDNVAMDEGADNTIEEKQYVDKSKAMKCV